MKYITNYKEWITPELMNYLELNDGETRPVYQPDKWKDHPLLEEFNEKCRVAYSHKNCEFQQFAEKDMNGLSIILPELSQKRQYGYWWFIKLNPGQMQPMHIDPFLVQVKNPVRYSLFLQDYIPGHIYVWDDKMISNYKKGDLFEWDDPMCIHGCTNISFVPRYTLQITLHDL